MVARIISEGILEMTYASIVRSITMIAVFGMLMGAVIALGWLSPVTPTPRAAADLAPTALARAAVPRTATMKIVPAPVIDPDAEVFIGTGDGSSGSWTRPSDQKAREGM